MSEIGEGAGIGDFAIGINAIGVLPDKYLDLITSEHNQKPKYMAILSQFLTPLVQMKAIAQSLNTLFDLDNAVGVQLDILGLWIGASRQLKTLITGVYFTYNTGPGYNIGIYKGPFDPTTGITSLPDAQYRLLLKATAAANQWNGEIESAYEDYDILLAGTPFSVLIYDWQDMSMTFALIGGVPDAVTEALFTGGYLSLKPDGVRVRDYITQAVPGPVFGYAGAPDLPIAGYNVGAYAKFSPGS